MINLKANVYIQRDPTITDKGVRQMISESNAIISNVGVNTQIAPSSFKRHDETKCYSFPLGNYDFKLCVGRNIGGYGWDTVNWNYDFLAKGQNYKNAHAHEVIHHLGVVDLYWLKIVSGPSYPASDILKRDMFYYCYHPYSYLCDSNKYVANGNLYRLEHFGKNSIIYPLERRPLVIIYHTNTPNTVYKLYKSKRNPSHYNSSINLNTPWATITSNSSGELRIPFAQLDGGIEFDLLYVKSNSRTFWITEMELEFYVNFKDQNYKSGTIHIPKQPTTPTPKPTPYIKKRSPCPPYGDLDGDGYVTSRDLNILNDALIHKITLTIEQKRRADLSGNGTVTTIDKQIMLQFLEGTTNLFPVCPTPTPTTTPTPTPYIKKRSPCPPFGDIDGDGYITQNDINMLADYIVGKISLSNEQKRRADVTGNGTVSGMDLSNLKYFLAGTINRFPVCTSPSPTPKPSFNIIFKSNPLYANIRVD